MPDEERAEINRRLREVKESLSSLHAMVEAGAPRGQILRQIYAVQAEMQSIKIQMLICQVNACKSVIQFSPSVDNRLTELHRLFDLYNTMIQSI
jgi:DNA-binding FrmR family transcriptional regulator